MRLLFLFAVVLQEAVAHTPPSCYQHTAALVPDQFGRPMARLKLRDPGGDVTINVTIYTRAKLDRRQVVTGKLDLVDKDRWSPNLIYNLHFPIYNPLPHIGMITFNHHVICQDESDPPFETYLTTTSYIQDVVRYKYVSGLQISYENKINSKFSSKTIKKLGSWIPKIPARIQSKVSCGQSTVPSQLVHGGMPVVRGDWPWLAIVYLEPTMRIFCGSTLISMKHVITAAHCMYHPDTKEPFKMEDILVVLGQFNRTNMAERRTQRRKVKDIVVHHSFHPHDVYLHGDIAVLVLASEAQFSPYVRHICLWDSDTRLDRIQGQEAKVAGWGLRENMQMTDTPYVAVIPIVSQEDCLESHPTFNEVDQDLTFCGGQRTGMGPCMGDSGSGLALQRTLWDGSTRWYLRGVVSFNARSNETICHLDGFSLFTDVAKYAHWIKKVMRTT